MKGDPAHITEAQRYKWGLSQSLLELHVHQTTQLITARGAVMQRESFKWAMTKNSLHCYWTFLGSFSLKMKLLQSHCPASRNYWPKKTVGWMTVLWRPPPHLWTDLHESSRSFLHVLSCVLTTTSKHDCECTRSWINMLLCLMVLQHTVVSI